MSAPARRRTLPVLLLVAGGLLGVATDRVFFATPATLKAEAVDRNEKMAVFTSPLSIGRPGQGVFVLDSTTGTLVGGVLGNGGFNTSYSRNIAADFGDRAGLAEYAVVAGPSDNGSGVIYIAENRSGVLVAYAVPDGSGRQFPLVPAGKFNFKAAMQ